MSQSKNYDNYISKLRKRLWYLKENYGIIGVKGGTEVEDMNFLELKILREISEDIVPMTVKIGGAEARNDIRECLSININTILAPMIESRYAFSNFYSTVKQITNLNVVNLAINIETITSYSNLNQIIYNEGFENIYQVTIGRGDLASSMDQEVNSDNVIKITNEIVQRVKKENKKVSVGGKINPISGQIIKEKINPDYINTRHVTINLKKVRYLTFSICEALAFEIELYKSLIELNPNSHYSKASDYIKRIEKTKERMAKRNIITSSVASV